MMYAREKSDLAIVATKPTNKAERSAAEPVEPRAGAEGNALQHGTDRAQYRGSRDTRAGAHAASGCSASSPHPRWEPYALIGPVRFCAGGAQQ